MMDGFIRSHIKKISIGSNDPVPVATDCMEIKRVARVSVAAAVGVAAGDFLVSMNGHTASRLEMYPYQRPFERIAEKIRELQGARPVKETRWLRRQFPTDYDLPILEGKGTVRLSQVLELMGGRKILVICLLATYRCNGPYNDFMTRYRNYASYFGAYLHGLHVITMESRRKPDRPDWHEMEDKVRDSGLPLAILLEEGEVTDAVMTSVSPFILALNAEGVIVHEGDLNSVDIWDAVAAVAEETAGA